MWALYQGHLSGAIRRYESYARNGSMRFNSSRSRNMSGLRGPDGLRWELKLAPAKKTTRGCLQDYSARHYPFKTLNGWLNAIKALGIIRNCPFQALRSLREGWPWDNSGCPDLNPFWTNSGSWASEALE